VYSEGALIVEDSTIQPNMAIGGTGADGFIGGEPRVRVPGTAGGDGHGGGLAVGDGTVTISNSTFKANTARGGDGGNGARGYTIGTAGGDGGNGLGSGVHASGAITVELRNTIVTANAAQGGSGGAGQTHKLDDNPGEGIGGGLYIDVGAALSLDAFIKKNLKGNTASTNHSNLFGSYVLIP
jgi:hypothetical protein